MPAVKPLDRISSKWARVAAASQSEYEEGIKNPRKSWSAETAKAESAYEAGIQQAISKKRFSAGVKKAGDAKWQENALAKGPARWSQGIGLSTAAYEQGFAPFRAVIEGITLPARGPKGDPKNIRRVEVIAKALHEKKLAMAGG